MGNSKELTRLQLRFVKEYILDPTASATECVRRAGYNTKNPDKIAYQLLGNARVKELIDKVRKDTADKLELSAEWVLQRLKNISDRCIQAEPVLDREGNPVGEYKFDSAGANKSTELIGKHLKLFTDKIEHSGEIGIKKLEDFM